MNTGCGVVDDGGGGKERGVGSEVLYYRAGGMRQRHDLSFYHNFNLMYSSPEKNLAKAERPLSD